MLKLNRRLEREYKEFERYKKRGGWFWKFVIIIVFILFLFYVAGKLDDFLIWLIDLLNFL